jgi:predicted secreted Zn-dependent protease
MILLTLLLLALQTTTGPDLSAYPEASPRLLAAAPGVAELENTTLRGYEVRGRNARAVRASINDGKPADLSGARHDAVTYWNYRWQLSATNGRCDPARTAVTYTVTVVLPDLATVDQMNRTDREKWNTYFAALVLHETNHVRIAAAGAQGVQQAMRAAPDCESAQAVGLAENRRVGAASAEYDRLTRHGRNEGAVF